MDADLSQWKHSYIERARRLQQHGVCSRVPMSDVESMASESSDSDDSSYDTSRISSPAPLESPIIDKPRCLHEYVQSQRLLRRVTGRVKAHNDEVAGLVESSMATTMRDLADRSALLGGKQGPKELKTSAAGNNNHQNACRCKACHMRQTLDNAATMAIRKSVAKATHWSGDLTPQTPPYKESSVYKSEGPVPDKNDKERTRTPLDADQIPAHRYLTSAYFTHRDEFQKNSFRRMPEPAHTTDLQLLRNLLRSFKLNKGDRGGIKAAISDADERGGLADGTIFAGGRRGRSRVARGIVPPGAWQGPAGDADSPCSRRIQSSQMARKIKPYLEMVTETDRRGSTRF